MLSTTLKERFHCILLHILGCVKHDVFLQLLTNVVAIQSVKSCSVVLQNVGEIDPLKLLTAVVNAVTQ
jgi:hypothetical protein